MRSETNLEVRSETNLGVRTGVRSEINLGVRTGVRSEINLEVISLKPMSCLSRDLRLNVTLGHR